jgi:hypothetical protein
LLSNSYDEYIEKNKSQNLEDSIEEINTPEEIDQEVTMLD